MPLRSQCGSVLAEQDLKSFQLLRLPQEFFPPTSNIQNPSLQALAKLEKSLPKNH